MEGKPDPRLGLVSQRKLQTTNDGSVLPVTSTPVCNRVLQAAYLATRRRSAQTCSAHVVHVNPERQTEAHLLLHCNKRHASPVWTEGHRTFQRDAVYGDVVSVVFH